MASTKPALQTFEFTKRKRWSETLFSELSETIVFILSPTCKVLFCGSAIVGLLGWKEDQLVDADLSAFIEDEDQESFRWSFNESLRTGQDMYIYSRFKYEQPGQADPSGKLGLLFELKGHPHYAQGQSDPECLFLTAMPYPSRNIAMLNTFLDFRMENERLSERINELKSLETSSRSTEVHSPSPPRFPMQPYMAQRLDDPSVMESSTYPRSGTGQHYYAPSATNILGAHNDLFAKGEGCISSALEADDDENGHRKKKPKKMLVSDEQRVCVTCGRTDSPEWRKGPLGPKTLCNACGLRWAKRSRKPEQDHSPIPGPSSKGQDPDFNDSSCLAGAHKSHF